MAYKNKADQVAAARRHYEANRQKMIDRAQAATNLLREAIRDYIRELKNLTPCADCKVRYPYYVMQFDHLHSKKFNLADSHKWTSWQRVLAEIDKCEIVCANCHAQRTHRRRGVA